MEGRRRFFGHARWAACAYVDHDVHLWDLEAGTLAVRLSGHWGDLTAGAFDDAGQMLATAGAEGSLRVWSVPDGAQTHELVLGERIVRAMVFRAGRLRLVTDDGAVVAWSLYGPPVVEVAPTEGEPVRCAAFAAETVWWGRGRGFGRQDRATPDADGLHWWEKDDGKRVASPRPRATLLDADARGVAFGAPTAIGVLEQGASGPSWSKARPAAEIRLSERRLWSADAHHVVSFDRRTGATEEDFDAPGRVDDLVLRAIAGSPGRSEWEVWARVDGGASLVELRSGRRLEPRGLEGRARAAEEVTRFRLDRVLGASGFAVPEFRPEPPPALAFREVAVALPAEEPAPEVARDERWRTITERLRQVRDRLRHPGGGAGRGYREQARTVGLHRSGHELELALGEVRVRLRVAPEGRGVRVELVGARGEGVAAPPTTLVRLARWVRRRQGRPDDDALVAALRSAPGARDVRLARSGQSVSVSAQLRTLPSAAMLAAWTEQLGALV